MPQIIVSLEDDFPQIVELEGPKFAVGRHSGNNLQLPFSFISSFHAEMTRDANGNYRLTDLNSHNGTYINGSPVNNTSLRDGDEVSFGPIKGRYIDSPRSSSAGAIPEARPAYIADGPGPAEGAPVAMNEARLATKLREKIMKDLERETAQVRAELQASRDEFERLKKESEIQKSDMAMRQHILRDLESTRIREQQKLEAARAQTEGLEAARHEFTEIQAKIVESRDAGAKAEAALRHLMEAESRSVDLDASIIAKRKEASELDAHASNRRKELESARLELEKVRREVDEIGGARLHELQEEIERLGLRSAELDKGIALRSEQAEVLDIARRETEKKASEFAQTAGGFSKQIAEREKELAEMEGTFTKRRKEIAAADDKIKSLREEAAQYESELLPSLKEKSAALRTQTENLQRDLDTKQHRFHEIDREREAAEKQAAEAKARLDEATRQLEEYHSNREKQVKELQEARSTIEVLKKEIEKNSSANENLLEKRRLLEEEMMNSGRLRDELQAKIKESQMAASQGEAEVKKLEEVLARQKEVETELRGQQENLAALGSDLDSKRVELAEVAEALQEGRDKIDEFTNVRLVKLQSEADELENQKVAKRQEIDSLVAALEKEKETKRKEIEAVQGELEDEKRAKAREIEAMQASLEDEKRTGTGEIEAMQAEARREADAAKADLENRKVEARKEIEALQAELGKETTAKRDLLKTVTSELDKLIARSEREKTSLAEKTTEIKHLDQECVNRTAELKKLSAENDSLQKESATLKRDLDAARASLEEARRQIEDHRKVGIKVAAELRSLEEHRATRTRLENEITSRKEQLHQLDGHISEKRKLLRQVEKTLSAIQRTARKQERRLGIPLESIVDDADEETDIAKEALEKQASETAREDANLVRLIASKTTDLRSLEKELDDLAGGIIPAALPEVAPKSKKDDAPEAIPAAVIEPLDSRHEPAGVELLNTGDDEDNRETGDKNPANDPSGATTKVTALNLKDPAPAPKEEEAKTGSTENKKQEPEPAGAKPRSRGGFLASRFLRDDAGGVSGVGAVAAAVFAGGRLLGGKASAASRSRKPRPNDGQCIHIIHPRSAEETRDFADGPGGLDASPEPAIGLLAFAACSHGSVHRSPKTLADSENPVLLLLSGSLEPDEALVRSVAESIENRPLLASWREGRLEKLAASLKDDTSFKKVAEMLNTIDGIISTTPETTRLLDQLQAAGRTLEIPLPCPVDIPQWDCSLFASERRGAIFVNAEGFDAEIEDHRVRLEVVNLLAEKHRLRVTVHHHRPDLLANLSVPEELLDESREKLDYREYLKLVAQHRFTVGFGLNLAGGNVLGDALLAGTAYIGGRGRIESALFTGSSLVDGDIEDLQEKLSHLVTDADAYAKFIEASHKRALTRISFGATFEKLQEFIKTLRAKKKEVVTA